MSSTSDPERRAWLRAVGQAVREIRTRAGFTQEELGYRAKLDQTYVSGIERGRRNPTVWVVWRLAEALGTTPREIVTIAEERLEGG